MTPSELIRHYGGEIPKAAVSLGLHRQTVWQWVKQGYIPFHSQRLIEFVTHGGLKVTKRKAAKRA